MNLQLDNCVTYSSARGDWRGRGCGVGGEWDEPVVLCKIGPEGKNLPF